MLNRNARADDATWLPGPREVRYDSLIDIQTPIIQIARRRQRKRRKNLTSAEKSDLCQSCGKCCMAMTFEGGEADEAALDQIRWMQLHGVEIEYHRRRGVTSYYYTFSTPCSQLREQDGRYSCAIYETRPRMCRDYEGWANGPTGVPDCLWFEPDEPESGGDAPSPRTSKIPE